MAYLAILWFLSALFVAHLARREGRRPWVWFLAGLTLPIVSMVLVRRPPCPLGSRRRQPRTRQAHWQPLSTPASERSAGPLPRCEGHYIHDCPACPCFRGTSLFGDTSQDEAGYCTHLRRTLWRHDATRKAGEP